MSAKRMLADAVTHPILFSTPMVQAIFAGHKTQTRRIVSERNSECTSKISELDFTDVLKDDFYEPAYFKVARKSDNTRHRLFCKYKVGDVLWVRETYREIEQDFGKPRYEYKATETINLTDKWKPSIYMPKEACRLFLEITDYRLEKLNSINPKDAEREGIEHLGGDIWKDYMNKKCFPEFMQGSVFTRTHSFKSLWQKINGVESWEENPFVWVISFKLAECPNGFR